MKSESNVEDIYSLSPLQKGLFFHWLLDKNSSVYFDQIEITLTGKLDIPLLEQSLNRLIERYDVLRTIFIHEKVKEPVQVVLKDRKQNIVFTDISEGDGEKLSYIEAFKQKDREKGFDLSKDLLTRMTVFRTGKDAYRIVWSVHHIVVDGWSLGIIFKDLINIYKFLDEGLPVALQAPIPYRHYINWLEQKSKNEGLDSWRQYLEDYGQPALLPRKPETGNRAKYKLARYDLSFDEAVTTALNAVVKMNEVTASIVVQTLWGILLHRYNHTRDAVFGAVVSGRPSEIDGIESMVGLFINTVPVRIKNPGGFTFSRLLREVQREAIFLKSYEYLSLAEVQKLSALGRNLINHILIFENYPVRDEAGKIENKKNMPFNIDRVEIREQTNYDFNLYVAPGRCLSCGFNFNSEVYDHGGVKRIAGHFRNIVHQVVGDADIEVDNIEIIGAEEKNYILTEFNDTAEAYPEEKTIHEWFERQVEKTPDSMALTLVERQLTYRLLDSRADSLAFGLRKQGTGPGSIVGIMIERSPEMMTVIWAVLKAGGAYLPMDFEYPRERIRYMMEDSCATVLFSTTAIINRLGDRKFLPGFNMIDPFDERLFLSHGRNPGNSAIPRDPAYVIYTSGSSGKPKGVVIEHGNIVNFCCAMLSAVDFSPAYTILALTTISFDIFVLETIVPLVHGLKVLMVNESRQNDPRLLAGTILRNSVDMIQVTPSRLKLLLHNSGNFDFLRGVRNLMVGGEAFPDDLLMELRSRYRGKIYNMYGPTETSVWSMVKELSGEKRVSIGVPIGNTRIYIVNRHQQLQPPELTGELFIGGDGVCRGYLNKPELTEERVTADPFRAAGRLYRTGDLARLLKNGDVECLGRLDQQVKIRGFRIELGEIENRLLHHHEIGAAAVVAREDENGGKSLYAYYTAGKELTVSGIRAFLSEALPMYMIPAYFIRLERIPLTPNGKIDRQALPVASGARPNLESAYVSPRNMMEKKAAAIWRELLRIEEVGVNDSFFELGGDSNKLIQLVSRLNDTFNKDIPIMKLFEYPTIRSFIRYFRGERSDEDLAEDRSGEIDAGRSRLEMRLERRKVRDVSN